MKHPTTLAFVNLEQEEPQYAFFFNQAADRSLTVATLPRLPANTDALHLSMGAVTLATQPVASAFAALFEQNKGKLFTSFDPNIRDKMIDDAATYNKLMKEWLPYFDMVKVSSPSPALPIC